MYIEPKVKATVIICYELTQCGYQLGVVLGAYIPHGCGMRSGSISDKIRNSIYKHHSFNSQANLL